MKVIKMYEKEKCVLCDKETKYTKDTSIHKRFFYIEGVGQLCYECYEKTYGSVSKR